MAYDCIILDFDGTFTQVDREAAPFIDGFRRDLAELLGETIDDAWTRAAAQIGQDPNHYGWEWEGRIVAPSHADPYIQATSIAQLLFRERGRFTDQGERTQALQRLFSSNYKKALTVFRNDARTVVEALLDRGRPVFVATNSHTDAVADKLDQLAPRGRERLRLYGDAKKYVVGPPEVSDARYDALPAELHVPGLARPVLLRRGKYYDVLTAIWAESGATPETTLICGDIFELDLALPAELGVHVHLVARPGTPAYERGAVERYPHGSVSEELSALLDVVAAR